MLLPDELDIIVDGLLADVRNGGKTGKEGCDGLLVGMELVMPFFLLKDFLGA